MATAQLTSTEDGTVSEHVGGQSVVKTSNVSTATVAASPTASVSEHVGGQSVVKTSDVSTTTVAASPTTSVSEHVGGQSVVKTSNVSTATVATSPTTSVSEHVGGQSVVKTSNVSTATVAASPTASVSEHVGGQSVVKTSDVSTATVAASPTACISHNTNTQDLPHGTTLKSDDHVKYSVSQNGTQFLGSGPGTDKKVLSSVGSENSDKKCEGMKSSYGAGKAYFGMVFVRPGETLPSSNVPSGTSRRAGGSKASRSASQKKDAAKAPVPAVTFPPTPEAKPILSKEEYLAAWKNETDVQLQKLKKLAYEVVALKTARPNAKDKLHSAANRVPVRVEFNTESIVVFKSNNSFLCYVFVDRVCVASGRGLKIKDAKTNAYEAALQKILMPYIRILKLDPESSELEGSKEPFLSPPPEPSQVPLPKSSAKLPPSAVVVPPKTNTIKEIPSHQKESNLETACLKRRLDEQKPLEDFVIVEPLVPTPDCTPAHTLRRSADFNHMLLEYEYFFKGDAARCVVKIENNVLADINGVSKMSAKNLAASKALQKLKDICWMIKIKKEVDSDYRISKEDMLNELYDQSDEVIGEDNVGNRLLRKMGWYGGGVGKHGSGIVEPVSLSNVLNREGLGLGAKKEITEEFKKQVRQVIENYAASGNQEDLVFSYEFRLDERQVIHDECRRLNLSSKCRGKGRKRYLCVSRKRTANELFDHVMVSGGETARYVLVPPGFDEEMESQSKSNGSASSKTANKDGEKGKENIKGSDTKNTGKGLLPTPGLLGEAPVHPQDMVNSCHGPTAFSQGAPPLQGNPMRPFPGNRFGGPRPGGFAAPGVQNRVGQLRMGNNNMRSMQFHNGVNNEFDEGYGNNQCRWGPQHNNGCFEDFGSQNDSFEQEDMGMEFNEMNHFQNGEMGPHGMSAHGFGNNQNMGNQWGAQGNSECFQNYGNNHNGFENEHSKGFSGLGNNQGMGNQWGGWENNGGFQGECDYNSDFQNENMGMQMTGFPGGGNNQESQWGGENNPGNQWGGGNNRGNQWGGGNNQGNQWGGVNNQGNLWGGGNNRGNQWGGGNNQGDQWGGGNNQGNQWGGGNNQGNQCGGVNNPGNQWGKVNNPGNQWGGENNPGNQWGGGNNQGNQWGGGNNQGDQWSRVNNQGDLWGGVNNQGDQWGRGHNQGDQWGAGNNQGDQWGAGNNQGDQWGGGNNQENQWGGGNNQGNQWGMPQNNGCFQNVSDFNCGFKNQEMGMHEMGFGEPNNIFAKMHDVDNNPGMEDQQGSGYCRTGGSDQNNVRNHRRGHRIGFGNRGMGNRRRKSGMFHKGPNMGGSEAEQMVNGDGSGGLRPSEFDEQQAGKKKVRGQQSCGGGNEGNTQQNIGQNRGKSVSGKRGGRQGRGSHRKSAGPRQEKEAGTVR